MNKTIIIIVSVIVIILIILILYYYFNSMTEEISKLYIETQKSNKPSNFLNEEIKTPLDGTNYSMSFFIYIDNYVENFEYWKHVLHKGSELNSKTILKYTDWDELIMDSPIQNPGIWINPKGTTLRLSFQIKKNTIVTPNDKDHIYNSPTDNDDIEYAEIEIPYKKMTHIAFYTKHQVLYVYLNGILRKIHTFNGYLESNTNNMYFNQPLSYNGSIFKFNYIPYPISSDKILEYSKDIPNIKLIPKKTRFMNFIKRFKFRDALQSFFM